MPLYFVYFYVIVLSDLEATSSKPGNNLYAFLGARLHTATLLDPTQLETISTHWLKLHFFLFNCVCRSHLYFKAFQVLNLSSVDSMLSTRVLVILL